MMSDLYFKFFTYTILAPDMQFEFVILSINITDWQTKFEIVKVLRNCCFFEIVVTQVDVIASSMCAIAFFRT